MSGKKSLLNGLKFTTVRLCVPSLETGPDTPSSRPVPSSNRTRILVPFPTPGTSILVVCPTLTVESIFNPAGYTVGFIAARSAVYTAIPRSISASTSGPQRRSVDKPSDTSVMRAGTALGNLLPGRGQSYA